MPVDVAVYNHFLFWGIFEAFPKINFTYFLFVKVLKLRLPSENADHFDYVGNYEIIIEDHMSCMEQCIVKREDCNSRQIYIENECACRCESQEECPAVGNKRWDEKTCRCECVQEFTCEGYAIFNRDTCQ